MTALSNDPVAAGRCAWERLKGNARTSWDDWLIVARGIKVLRDAALKAADTDKPYGKVYTRLMAASLRENGFDDVGQQVRWRLLQVLENMEPIERWRAGLSDSERHRCNHPDSIMMNWRRAAEAPAPPGKRLQIARAARTKGSGGRAIHWGGDHIRRAATALRDARASTDYFLIARLVLQAAIRTEDDLFELLPGPAANTPKPRPVTAAVSHHANRIGPPFVVRAVRSIGDQTSTATVSSMPISVSVKLPPPPMRRMHFR
jgi:hypothetical protein